MRAVSTIPTPWVPYSVMFSHDGTRLAIGGGSWYGEGGIQLVDLTSGDSELLRWEDLPGAPGTGRDPYTTSGVCFSADDRHLAASMWSSGQNSGPTFLFAVSGLHLTHQARSGQGRGCPTGVLLLGRTVVSRNHRTGAEHLLNVWQAPQDLDLDAGFIHDRLTSSRLIVAHGSFITGTGNCLLAAPLGNPKKYQLIPVRAEVTGRGDVTAIAVRSADRFITGGIDGELIAWNWQDEWRQQRIRPATSHLRPTWPLDVIWANYNPNSIVGICSLPIGDGWASVSAGGEVCLWAGSALLRCWQLPEPGSPRSLAAHPDRNLLAVGIKKGGWARPQSAVVLVETDAHQVDPAWRSPDVVKLAEAANAGRTSQGALDPVALSILADALEDAGCGAADLLAHLRDHGPHLCLCWVVERLLARQ